MSDEINRRMLFTAGVVGAAGALLNVRADAQEGPPNTGQSQTEKQQALPPMEQKEEPPPLVLPQIGSDRFQRSAPEERQWETIRQNLAGQIAETVGETLQTSVAKSAARIERDFAFASAVADEAFSSLHIEPLLDQASDLLDRGLRDRATWDETAARMLQLTLDLNEYAEVDAIHQEEEREGIYDVPARESAAQHAAESLNVRYQEFNERLVQTLLETQYSSTRFDEVYNAARKAAWLVGLVPYTWKDQEFTGYVNHTWDGVGKKVADLSVDAAEVQAVHSLVLGRENLRLQKETYDTLAEVSRRLLPGLEARADWDLKNATFQRRRTLVARKYQDLKSKAATAADGILNYGKRLPAIKQRFHQDFRDAVARLRVVYEGLRTVYGYDDPLPSDDSSIDYFDECLLWARRAVQFLIRFSRQDQTTVIPISVRQRVSDKEWDNAVKTRQWTFEIADGTFAEMAHVRLRGISAFVREGLGDERLWRIGVRVPTAARIQHLSGRAVTINQRMVPECQLSRVQRRDSRREPDIVGVSALHNSSPAGTWRVRVVDSLPRWSHWSELKDIEIDLHVTYRNVEAAAMQKAMMERR